MLSCLVIQNTKDYIFCLCVQLQSLKYGQFYLLTVVVTLRGTNPVYQALYMRTSTKKSVLTFLVGVSFHNN